MHHRNLIVLVAIVSVVFAPLGPSDAFAAVPTILNYQGILTNAGGTPITTMTTVVFTIYTAPAGGMVRWTETRNVTPNSEGQFAILLGQAAPLHDSVFEITPLFLGVQVGADPELTPRSVLSSAAYSFRIATVDGSTGGQITGHVDVLTDGSGPGVGIRDPGGNVGGHTPTSSFFDDTDGDRLVEIGTVGLYFVEPSTGDTIFLYDPNGNLLAIGPDNLVTGNNSMAVGFNNTVTGLNSATFGSGNSVSGFQSSAVGTSNSVSANFSSAFGMGNVVDSGQAAVALGTDNLARGMQSFVCGIDNRAHALSSGVFGGQLNTATGFFSVVAGGVSNLASGSDAFIGGGQNHTASGADAAIMGGTNNRAAGGSAGIVSGTANRAAGMFNFIGAGFSCSTSSNNACIVGGSGNTSTGIASIVGAGSLNGASGNYSIVASGFFNRALADNATVSGGNNNQASDTSSCVAGGGFNSCGGAYSAIGGGYANTTNNAYATIPGGYGNMALGRFSFAAGRSAQASNHGTFVWADTNVSNFASSADNEFSARASGGVRFFSSADLSTGVTLAAGGGAWASVSDRNVKENIEPVSGEEVLEKLSRIPIAEWNYIAQGDSIRHIGPMAQDFYAAFGVGEDDKHITTIDADGVALAAIQALYDKQKSENQELLRQIHELRQMIETSNQK